MKSIKTVFDYQELKNKIDRIIFVREDIPPNFDIFLLDSALMLRYCIVTIKRIAYRISGRYPTIKINKI